MFIKVGSLNIHYNIIGRGDSYTTILQGWGTNYHTYDSIAASLSSKTKVIQLDLPGFGKSDEPPIAWTVHDYMIFFLKFMKKLNIDSTNLIGHSYGGRIIIKLLYSINQLKIGKVILIDSAGIVHSPSFITRLHIKKYKFLKKVTSYRIVYNLFPELVDYWNSKQGSEDYRNASVIMKQCLVKAVNEDLSKNLEHIDKEVLLLWGKNDDATPIEDGKLMHSLLKESELIIFEKSGHYPFLDEPTKCNSVINSYIEGDSNV